MIEAQGLNKSYGPVHAVQDVGFTIQRGEVVGFLGPNGAGKSTTMKMLTGSLLPDAGSVRIAGDPVLGEGLEAKSRIGYLPEHTPLYRGMRVDRFLDFVGRMRGLSSSVRRQRLEEVIDRCDLTGYTLRRIAGLSKGYKQRVGLAQALLSDPDVLILDEPTSGLDPAELVRIRDLIVELSRDKTILLSTHILPEVSEVCRRVLILSGGRLVADGGLLELSSGQGERLSLTLLEPAEGVVDALRKLEGVEELLGEVRGVEGRVRYDLEVSERFATGERVARLALQAGWRVAELRHAGATLEDVFLRHTRGAASQESGEVRA
ncbi:MAG: ATP-binding cassette domain-containing protein [Planctomycetes bacterium]|nr:ATP-binding cassette domain-containing protein [Planctomycetota bacterium]